MNCKTCYRHHWGWSGRPGFGLIAVGWLIAVAAIPSVALAISDAEPKLGPYRTIQAVSAIVRYGGQESIPTASLYNGAGLSDRHPLRAVHSDDLETIWTHPLGDAAYPVSVEFDLGKDFRVNEMWIWQAPGDSFLGERVKEFDIVMRDANREILGVLESGVGQIKGSGFQASPRFSAFGECVFLPIDDWVRSIEVRILSNLGSEEALSLAEVMFAGREKMVVPEPSALSALFFPLILAIGCRFRRPSCFVHP